jgi:hypothetical protein
MPKRSSRKDELQNALRVVEDAIGSPLSPKAKNPAAVALGRLGGLKGGTARAAKLTADERHKIAQKAARAHWAKVKKKGL